MKQYLESIKLVRLRRHPQITVRINALFQYLYELQYTYWNGTGKFYVTYEKIQEELGFGRNQISNYLKVLQEINFIKVTKTEKNSRKPYYYSINFEAIEEWYSSIFGKITSKAEPVVVEEKTIQDEIINTDDKVQKVYQYLNGLAEKGEYTKQSEEIDRIYPLLGETYKRGFRKKFLYYFRSKDSVREISGEY